MISLIVRYLNFSRFKEIWFDYLIADMNNKWNSLIIFEVVREGIKLTKDTLLDYLIDNVNQRWKNFIMLKLGKI